MISSMSAVSGTGKLPEGRAGRLCALALALLCALVLWLLAAMLSGALGDLKNAVENREILLEHSQALISSIPRLREQIADAAHTADGSSVLIEEDSDATAQARLQEIVQGLAQADQVDLSSQEPLPLVHRGAFEKLALRVSFTSSWPVFVKFLSSIGNVPSPRLLVDDMQIQAAGSTRLTDEARKGRQVDVSITLVALHGAAAATAPRQQADP